MEIALVAEQLLLDRTCDNCRWRARTERAERRRLVLVAERCLRRAVPEVGTCGEWAFSGGLVGRDSGPFGCGDAFYESKCNGSA